MSDAVREAALAALQAGLCVLPPKEDGSKAPDTDEWVSRQHRRTTEAEVRAFYANGRTGLGVITGAVSGGLELLDFDEPDLFASFRERAIECGLGELMQRIADGYLEETPKGAHVFYRCSEISGSTKLARRPKRPEEQRDPHDRIQVKIETRGEGGFAVIAPSHGRVNRDGSYTLVQGGPESIVTITPDERQELHELARSFDEMPREAATAKPAHAGALNGRAVGDLRPGDDFNSRATWHEILEPRGWRFLYEHGGEGYWRRPGKTEGLSATTNFRGSDLLYVFSTSTDFEAERGYDKFGALAVLEHGGDWAQAARALADRGFGSEKRTSRQAGAAGSTVGEDDGLFIDGAFVPARAGGLLKRESHIALGEDDRLYRYREGVYIADGEQLARARLRELLGDKFKRRHPDEVISWLRAESPTIPARPPEGLINVRNGLLAWRTGELTDHSPGFPSAIQIPIAWRPGASCPRIRGFLEEVLPDDATVALVLEIIGYALLASLELHIAVLLLGPGRNGKSVLLAILRALLGFANVARSRCSCSPSPASQQRRSTGSWPTSAATSMPGRSSAPTCSR
jgi:putative DNA primase/helicase